MFYRTTDVKKEIKKKIDVIYNGKNLEDVLNNAVKYSDVTYVIAPNKNQEEFLNEYNAHISKSNRVKKSICEMEDKSVKIGKYITIHQNEYDKLLKDSAELQKFKRNGQKAVSEEMQFKIREEYQMKDISQRELSRKYKVSLYVINRILNNKY